MTNKKAKGPRAKSRRKLKGGRKVTITKVLADIAVGSKVQIVINPAVHSAMPRSKFQGLTGTILGRRGVAFEVEVSDINAVKELIVHPAHLKLLN
ncbi:MAG: 50S ribosomal protein L21e [archaeon]